MRIIYKSILVLSFLIIIFISYLSIFGIETDKFNNQITNKINTINKDFEIELKKIKLILDPFRLKLNIRTIGSKFKSRNQTIEIESIKTQILLRSLFNNKFSIKNLYISTESVDIKNLISFLRSIQNTPELFILEKIMKKGYLIADIKVEFDSEGKVKDNFTINGFIKEAKLNLLKKYNIDKLNLLFKYEKDKLFFTDIQFFLNELNLGSKELTIKKIKNDFIIRGNIDHKNIDLNQKNLDLFIKPFISIFNIKKLIFNSKNNFSFKLNKKLQFKNLEIDSEILIDKFVVINDLNLKNFFPTVQKDISFSNNRLSLSYKKDDFLISGNGNILLQKKNDFISFNFKKKNGNLNFKTSLKVKDNPVIVDLLNYKKKQKNEILISLEGQKKLDNQIFVKNFLLKEKNNKIKVEGLLLNKKFQVINLENIDLDYIDKEKQKNSLKLFKKNKEYYLKGTNFNANKLIDDLLTNDESESSFFNINSKIIIDIDEIYIDKDFDLKNFSGFLSFKDKKIFQANLLGNFTNEKKLNFTISTDNNEKITTFFIDRAEPIVRRYKFIKGFDEGSLDFYSSNKFGTSTSTLKIYNFKLKELPALTKILTLASLQGIADILSGEGIRFDEFEMNFTNKASLMTINEIYAIGPAISILMDGYVEKEKLVSLRGTLVPATTINKVIGTIPILGKILVGSKTGEGVFGVSFKIKGSPKNLETTVNPIKTLTPRFITRTLEKIKKN